jgi:hypothetical protein
MPLHQRKQRKLFAVAEKTDAEKTDAKVVALRNIKPPPVKKIRIKTMLMPPLTLFNMGYLKEKENDPL